MHIPGFVINRNYRNWHQLFYMYNRFGSHKIHAFYRFSFFFFFWFTVSITLKHSTELKSFFQKLAQFSHRSDQGKVGKTPIENARYGPEKIVWNNLILHYKVHFDTRISYSQYICLTYSAHLVSMNDM